MIFPVHDKKISTIVVGTMTSILLTSAMSMMYAEIGPYIGNVGPQGQTGAYTLEAALAIQKGRVDTARDNPASGSGTPYLDANGVVGASLIAGTVFGGVAGAFFIRGRSGKYSAMGRGYIFSFYFEIIKTNPNSFCFYGKND